ncbi:hypothetical protein AGMMS49949_02070 [Alphaproteobacteria bacterium]|nr:hypothetical protein AGMMS49949_02070 [Alphaproteobacteria bacterium]GHS95912.1 hypothetical protein AGMMS50296_1420 [Alphaproteobacteria bacterium]
MQLWRKLGTRSGFQQEAQEPEGRGDNSLLFAQSSEDPTKSQAFLQKAQKLQPYWPQEDAFAFLKRCEGIFEETLEAYAKNRHETLKKYLSENVYESFAERLKKRAKKKQNLLIDIKNLQASLENVLETRGGVEVVVQFKSEQMFASVNVSGESFDNPACLFVPKKNTWTFQILKGQEDLKVVEMGTDFS